MVKAIEEYMSKKKDFSGVVLVSKGDEVLYKEAFGWKNREQSIKNDLQTKFYVGSMISKPITALSIMQLIDRGMVSLEQDIAEFFPFYKGKGMTIHHLLNHTSGIVNYMMLRKKVLWHQDYTPEQILQIVETENVKFTPGKKASYNNTAYLMLGLIIEKMTGLPYEQYVRKNILEPAQMTDTSFIRDGEEGFALNYVDHKKGPHISPTLFFACGELVSTIEDVLKFDRALKNGLLANKDTISLMEKPSYTGKFITVGYGWFIKNFMGHKSVCHGGNHMGGYTSHLERYLDDDVTVIVLSNDIVSHSKLSPKDFGGTFIAREIAAIVFNDKLRFWQKII